MADSSKNIKSSVEKLPLHVGIIMDGNGRWAKNKGLPRTNGHEEGLKRAKEIAKTASDLGIKYVTLYVFSTENWKRTQEEVGFLMNLIHVHICGELDFYRQNQIRIKMLGDKSGLPQNVRKDIENAEKDTECFTGLTLCLAINYGGRDELVRSIKKLIINNTSPDDITEKLISNNLDLADLPDVDLLIRTGGEKRLSNFLLWQTSYAELVFKDTLWPDYRSPEFINDVESFSTRDRRFGAVK